MSDKNTEPNEFEVWLRTVCFQKPTEQAYSLAKDAWNTRHDTQELEQLRQENRELSEDIVNVIDKSGEHVGKIQYLEQERDELKAYNQKLRDELKKHDTYMSMGVPRENKTVTVLLKEGEK